MASNRFSADQVKNLFNQMKIPTKWKIQHETDEESNEPGPNIIRYKEEGSSEYASIKSHPTGSTTDSEPGDDGKMVIYHSSVFQPFFRTPGEVYQIADFHHAPLIRTYLQSDAFLSKASRIKRLIIDASNPDQQLRSVKLNARFDQLVCFEARFINFEEYDFLRSPNIHSIFLDAVSFGKLASHRRPTDEFKNYEAPLALLPKNQIKAFASCDYLDWRFFYQAQVEQILDQVVTLDRIHLNVLDGRWYAHNTLNYLARKSKFVKLKKLNLFIGKSLGEFLKYLHNWREEFESACYGFVLRKGALQLFGIPISRYVDVRPVLEFIQLMFRLMKVYHLVEINPTFFCFALCRKTCTMMKQLSSKLCPSYRYLVQRFCSSAEVLQCTNLERPEIFMNFQNVWGLYLKMQKGFFFTNRQRKSFYKRFLLQFLNCPAIHSLAVTSRVAPIDNEFLDRLPNIFRNLASLSIEVSVRIQLNFILKFANLSTVNLLLEHPVKTEKIFKLVRGLKRLMYLRVESKLTPTDSRALFDEFKRQGNALLKDLNREYLECSYHLSREQLPYVRRFVTPVVGKRSKKVKKLSKELRSISL